MEGQMQNRYIMTAFGKDRPGIVADVTSILYGTGCNLEDTTMSMLSDEFTINLLFSSSDAKIEAKLLGRCAEMEKTKSISAFIRPLKERSAVDPPNAAIATIHVEGLDQAGIVYKISQYLADNSLNIIDLKSIVKTTPESGTSLYLMDIHIHLTRGATPESIQKGLDDVAEELNVEITVTR
jgi:glycine cleavage system transcriptional repressor